MTKLYKPINQNVSITLTTYKGHCIVQNEQGKSMIIDKANLPYFFEAVV